jgi:hypothetical protein
MSKQDIQERLAMLESLQEAGDEDSLELAEIIRSDLFKATQNRRR